MPPLAKKQPTKLDPWFYTLHKTMVRVKLFHLYFIQHCKNHLGHRGEFFRTFQLVVVEELAVDYFLPREAPIEFPSDVLQYSTIFHNYT